MAKLDDMEKATIAVLTEEGVEWFRDNQGATKKEFEEKQKELDEFIEPIRNLCQKQPKEEALIDTIGETPKEEQRAGTICANPNDEFKVMSPKETIMNNCPVEVAIWIETEANEIETARETPYQNEELTSRKLIEDENG